MRKQYIKQPIPEAISEDGGASVLFVNKMTVRLDGAITEAIAGNYVIGNATLIRNTFMGMMRSMADGVARDGHPRMLGNLITIYPVVTGEIDLDKGWDPSVNSVKIRARLLNEMELDITDWVFRDVTPGKRSFTLQSVKAGEELGVYDISKLGELNGKDLPSTEAGEPLNIHWEVEGTDKSGDIAAAKLSSNVSRIDIAAGAIEGLTRDEEGKTIVLTVRGNFTTGKITALVKLPPVPTVEVTAVNGQGGEDDVFIFWDGYCRVKGHNLMLLDGDTVKIKGTNKSGAAVEHVFEDVEYLPETDQILIDISEEEAQPFKDNWDGDKQLTFVVTSRGGVAASEPQVVEHDVAFGG